MMLLSCCFKLLLFTVEIFSAETNAQGYSPGFAPVAKDNDTTAIRLREIAKVMRTLQPKQTRDGGGFFGGSEAGDLLGSVLRLQAMLTAIQSLTGGSPPAPTPAATPPSGSNTGSTTTPPPPGSPPAASSPSLQQILAILSLTGGGGSDDANELAQGLVDTDRKCTPIGGLCDPHTAIRKILVFPNHVLLVGDEEVFTSDKHGNIFDGIGQPKSVVFNQLGGTPTSSMRIADLYYIFYGTKVEVFNSNGTSISGGKIATTSVFFGVKDIVRGSFRFNEHTLTIFFEKYFIFYQPLVNPPVDPRFSPQPIDVIPGGPDRIDGAVEIDGIAYLYNLNTLYEIADDEMKVIAQKPIRKWHGRTGWLQCDTFCKT